MKKRCIKLCIDDDFEYCRETYPWGYTKDLDHKSNRDFVLMDFDIFVLTASLYFLSFSAISIQHLK